MTILTYYEAMDLLVTFYDRYINNLLTEKTNLLKELKSLSGEPLPTIERMVNEHRSN